MIENLIIALLVIIATTAFRKSFKNQFHYLQKMITQINKLNQFIRKHIYIIRMAYQKQQTI